MLSKTFLKYFSIVVKSAAVFGFMWYTWDDKNQIVVKTKSKLHRIYCYVVLFSVIGNCALSAIRMYLLLNKKNLSDNLVSLVLCSCFFIWALLAMASLLLSQRIAQLANSAICYLKHFKEKHYTDQNYNATSSVDNLYKNMIVSTCFFPLVGLFFFLETQDALIYLPAMLPKHNQYFLIRFSYLGLMGPHFAGQISFVFYIFLIGGVCVHCQSKICREIRCGSHGKFTKTSTRTVDSVVQIVRSQAILFSRQEEAFRSFLVPLRSILTRTALVLNFVLVGPYTDSIGMLEKLLFAWTISMVLIPWFGVLIACSNLYKSSNGCKKSWKKYKNPSDKIQELYMKSFYNSWIPMKVKIGDVGSIKIIGILKFVNVLSRGTIKMLCATT